ncbi:unnamed protein product [Coregonus sp. 'balchen']|nr:unnamed protein product [Coregonus sp. 'balchen']
MMGDVPPHCRPLLGDISEKCEVVIQGRKTFGLVSPKINRRRLPKPRCLQSWPTLHTLYKRTPDPSTAPPLEITQQPLGHYAVPRLRSSSTSAEPSTHHLQMGVACLTGGRDRTGRLVVEVYGDQEGWRSPLVSSRELCKLLLYPPLCNQSSPPPQLNKALLVVQTASKAES